MTERSERAPRPWPVTMLDGDKVEQELQERNRIKLEEGTKAFLILTLPQEETRNLGSTILTKPFEGALEQVITTEYIGLPNTSRRLNLAPYSAERREHEKERDKLTDLLNDFSHKQWHGLPFSPSEGAKLKQKRNAIQSRINSINRTQAKEFLADMQEDLDFFAINPNQVQKITLQVAVNRTILPPL